jgi:hypothetical protein
MFVTKEEALRRLNSPRNISALAPSRLASIPAPVSQAPVSQVEIKKLDHTKPGRTWLTEEKRTEIAAQVIQNPRMSQKDIGLMHGVSPQTVNAAKVGRSGRNPPTLERKAVRADLLAQAKDTALEKLMVALGLLDEERMSTLESAKDVSRFSKDMASVFSSLTSTQQTSAPPVNLIIYAPESKKESQFKVVDV